VTGICHQNLLIRSAPTLKTHPPLLSGAAPTPAPGLMSPSSAPVFRHRLCSHSHTAISGNVNISPLMLQPLRRAPLSLPTCPWNPRRLGSTPLCPGHHLLITR
jgi:hypothetical protein